MSETVRSRPIALYRCEALGLRAGEQTQLRRPIYLDLGSNTHSPFQGADQVWRWMTGRVSHIGDEIKCPYGVIGDHLWGQETWKPTGLLAYAKPLATRACGRFAYRADKEQLLRDKSIPWRSSTQMPEWASRIRLELVDVRPQRVQEITHEDALANGCRGYGWVPNSPYFASPHVPEDGQLPDEDFRDWWNHLYARRGRGWDLNPWVWALTVRLIEAGDGKVVDNSLMSETEHAHV